ncbi:MAG TPA: Hsp70 family protein [Candidatus Methylomirabilis sp.]|nr:Hsp70 family protein [Candidatus Methylomirabilis sp.]
MRLGIDFGTTRTRVAAVLRGNYPLISFEAGGGGGADWYPSLIAAQADRLAFGLRAQAVQYEPGWEVLRSFKRRLGDIASASHWKLGDTEAPAIEWLTRFLTALRQDLLRHSNLGVSRRERLEVMVGVPANANSNQRFLTLEACRQAGFDPIGMLNEPSAAGIEYAHRYRTADMSRRREHVVVYDLGGGTFDAAVISMIGSQHDVIASEGISRLGGDDFDEALLELALNEGGLASADLPVSRSRLLDLCREAKEGLNSNSRKVVVDFGQVQPEVGEVMVPIAGFHDRCRPLIHQTIQATEKAMQAAWGETDGSLTGVAAVYLVGGSCELPVLARALRERFGRRVRRSPYPPAATAIGLAIAADQGGGYALTERFSRHFGVWREGESGEQVVFDPIFRKQTPLPQPGQPALQARREYHPVHNVGRFRFLECSSLGDRTEPAGDILSWKEVVFPFAPDLTQAAPLEKIRVERNPEVSSYAIEEVYRCDAAGMIEVAITNLTTGYTRTYRVR